MDAPLSLDLLCKVFADSNQNIDLGKFLLALCVISQMKVEVLSEGFWTYWERIHKTKSLNFSL